MDHIFVHQTLEGDLSIEIGEDCFPVYHKGDPHGLYTIYDGSGFKRADTVEGLCRWALQGLSLDPDDYTDALTAVALEYDFA